jgi:hypothetical protein
VYWNCICDCGNKTVVSSHELSHRDIKSCGCLQRKTVSEIMFKHGFSYANPNATEEQRNFYQIWCSMKTRCSNPNIKHYNNYGGRGITVCDRWLKFENFRDDMWESYLAHVKKYGLFNTSIDRFPNKNGNYKPANTRWATNSQQMRNTRKSSDTENYEQHNYWKRILQAALTRIVYRGDIFCKYLEYFGCTSQELRKHIESQFESWMNWSNHGQYRKGKPRTWNIDHIDECSTFDLSKKEDRLSCFNFKNLRPMCSKQNKQRKD